MNNRDRSDYSTRDQVDQDVDIVLVGIMQRPATFCSACLSDDASAMRDMCKSCWPDTCDHIWVTMSGNRDVLIWR